MSNAGIKYLSPEQVANRWNVSSRLVRKLCRDGRIEGAIQKGRFWLIPQDAKRPSDNRVVSGEYKRPSKRQQLLLRGLLISKAPVYLIDLENDKIVRATNDDENAADEVYSRKLEKKIVSGYFYREDVPKLLAEATITNLRLKLATQEQIELRCRCQNELGDYEWSVWRYTVCERSNSVATYAVLTFETVNEFIRDKDLEKFLYDYSHKIRTSVNSMMGMLEIEEKNAEDTELLKHIREKETKALQELLDVIAVMAENSGIGEIKDAPMKKNLEAKPGSIKGRKVLLVEDNELNMDIAEYMLTDAGAVVTKAENGKVAVDLFGDSSQGDYDVIMMDIQMPVVDGYEATQLIRGSSHPDAKIIPIIAMTASAFPRDVRAAIKAGMNAYVTKPLNSREMVHAIAKACEQDRA